MNRLFQITALFLITFIATGQALPVFDAELAASPLMHEVRINYRGARKAVPSYEQRMDSSAQRV
ncbi:hypothetical protein BD408DRAFT_413823 [Parasitella parasitica]|nr:hypothetical protein BD408DRAFT_413823 [Parasitella parasitica]